VLFIPVLFIPVLLIPVPVLTTSSKWPTEVSEACCPLAQLYVKMVSLDLVRWRGTRLLGNILKGGQQ
jgi:hypothetical protein